MPDAAVSPGAVYPAPVPAAAQAADEPSFLLLVCREDGPFIRILSSQIVAGEVKPAYRLHVRPQVAQLLDENGVELTQAFYDVVRELHWDVVKEGTNELIGGKIPAPQIVFTVRVPYAGGARSLRLSQVKDPEALTARRAATPPSLPVQIGPQDTEELLKIPISQLPGPAEVKQ